MRNSVKLFSNRDVNSATVSLHDCIYYDIISVVCQCVSQSSCCWHFSVVVYLKKSHRWPTLPLSPV